MSQQNLKSRPQAVLFDMDGLLLDTERLCMEAFVKTRRIFGLSDAEDIFLSMIGTRADFGAKILQESLGQEISAKQFTSVWDSLIDELLIKGVPLRPGVRDLLDKLRDVGIPMGVATSTSTKRATKHLQDAELLQYFSHVVGGDQVVNAKPHPEPYIDLADFMSADVRQCLAFEDSDLGTQAAVASGATVVQVPDLKHPEKETRQLGHLIATDLTEGALAVGLWDVI